MSDVLPFPEARFQGLPVHLKHATRAVEFLASDSRVVGIALLGSFALGRPDKHADIDLLVLVPSGKTGEVLAEHRRSVVPSVGEIATIFPADHLGYPNQLVVFYKAEPPIHVDYQYEESGELVVQPHNRNALVLLDRTGEVRAWQEACKHAASEDDTSALDRLRYIEDRFWGWCSYALSKIERGELWEGRDAIEYIRSNVLVTLGRILRGIRHHEGNRRLEQQFPNELLGRFERTVPASHSPEAYRRALANAISTYTHMFDALPRQLRDEVSQVDHDYFMSVLPTDTTACGSGD